MKTKIIAHRGDTRYHPENTLSAFHAALENGADAIELDIHLTGDGELVVHHDYYLGNPDDGEGIIYEKKFAYISGLKIGTTEHIPTLEDVFELIGSRLRYEIELKGFTEPFLSKVIELVNKYNLAEKVEFTSPHTYVLSRLKVLHPALRVGAFVAPFPDWMDTKLGQATAVNNALLGGVDVLHCSLNMIDEAFIKQARACGLLIHAADCDTKEMLRVALALNVDQLSTNRLEYIRLIK